ncbi:radical SAM protein [Promethearchaeum syntrophicum]|uniref:Radical SAM protein n=1 Tax=Promethearchaeum syntrophicum TaxID=2594042 RepID=A0A5B9DFJ0_9ARCH|nr:radical SAM protein [Candidatus Prometheoarchaeum syntrophicum]QEE17553.1 Radical SAM superfamily protein [Candidatus Prometheoarchaeum syntrophicum]
MKIEFREAKSIITKSNIPAIDYVINPYTGCQHGCIYCYAEFMKRFTNHKGDIWGKFLDIKSYPWEKIKPAKYNGKNILFSSVTDPYLPLEKKFENTRKILSSLKDTSARISILTKSQLVTRDIDLFKQFENIEVGVSLNTLDSDFARKIEPFASKPIDRLKALEEIHKEGIETYVFISPIFPKITDYQEIIQYSLKFTDYYRFENLNFRPHNVGRIYKLIKKTYPNYLPFYKSLRVDQSFWDLLEQDIENYCIDNSLQCKIAFHHGGFSKSKKKIS